MKKIVLTVFILTGFMFASCNDDDNKAGEDGTVDVSKIYLPLKITAEDNTITYTYNEKGQVTKIAQSNSYDFTFNYAENKLVEVISVFQELKRTYTFSQSGTKITLNIEKDYNGPIGTDSEELTIDNNGNLIQNGFLIYSYDANGNIVKMTSDNGNQTNLTYDTKNGIFKNLKLPQWVIVHILDNQTNLVNNMVSSNFTSEDNPENNFSKTVEYQYNADNYPVKIESLSSTSDTYSQTIEYTKK